MVKGSRGSTLSEMVYARVTSGEKEKLERKAKKLDRTLSYTIRLLALSWLKKHDPKGYAELKRKLGFSYDPDELLRSPACASS